MERLFMIVKRGEDGADAVPIFATDDERIIRAAARSMAELLGLDVRADLIVPFPRIDDEEEEPVPVP